MWAVQTFVYPIGSDCKVIRDSELLYSKTKTSNKNKLRSLRPIRLSAYWKFLVFLARFSDGLYGNSAADPHYCICQIWLLLCAENCHQIQKRLRKSKKTTEIKKDYGNKKNIGHFIFKVWLNNFLNFFIEVISFSWIRIRIPEKLEVPNTLTLSWHSLVSQTFRSYLW